MLLLPRHHTRVCIRRAALPCISALCCMQFIAQPMLIPLVVIVSQPSPDCHLIDLDAGLVTTPHKSWLMPMGWFLPKQIISNIHMKIGVKGGLKSGKVRMYGGPLLRLPCEQKGNEYTSTWRLDLQYTNPTCANAWPD